MTIRCKYCTFIKFFAMQVKSYDLVWQFSGVEEKISSHQRQKLAKTRLTKIVRYKEEQLQYFACILFILSPPSPHCHKLLLVYGVEFKCEDTVFSGARFRADIWPKSQFKFPPIFPKIF